MYPPSQESGSSCVLDSAKFSRKVYALRSVLNVAQLLLPIGCKHLFPPGS
jgi:hypothetical protein